MSCPVKQIRDIVYEYVFFTAIEEIVIEHPLFQRLRFVFQNSSAYLTYPANQLTRFSHSLGVMHLGGDLFKNGVSNASKKDLEDFINYSRCLLLTKWFEESELESFSSNWNQDIGNVGEFGFDEISIFPENEKGTEFLLNFIWQSLRIACLIHDIGHFPFSHVFEMGLDDYQKGKKDSAGDPIQVFKKEIREKLGIDEDEMSDAEATELHEFFGAFILKEFAEKSEIQENAYFKYFEKCLRFAEDIFLVEDPKDTNLPYKEIYAKIDPHQILPCLHRIVSSEIDADRLDYVLRDAESSGINLGNFDYERIIDNAIIVGRKLNDQTGIVFRFFIGDKAISSIEQFFNHRYLLYQHLYFHHNVSKYDGILIRIIQELLEMAIDDENKEVIDILSHYKFIENGSFISLHHIENYDDCWLRTCLQSLYREREKFHNSNLSILLETFLYRKSQNTFSFIKKSSDIDTFLSDFYEYCKKEYHLDDKIEELLDEYHSSEQYEKLLDSLKLIRLLLAQYFEKKLRRDFINNVRADLEKIDIIFIHKDTPPKLLKSETEVWRVNENKPVAIANLSLYLSSFSTIKRFAFKHYLGIIGDNVKHDSGLVKRCKDLIFKNLYIVLENAIKSEKEEANVRIRVKRQQHKNKL